MMLACWYIALKHTFADDVPPELRPHRDGVQFARYLVLTDRLSDWGPYQGAPCVRVRLRREPPEAAP